MKRYTTIFLILLLFTFGCTQKPSESNPEYGSLPIQLNLAPALEQGLRVSEVVVQITKGSFSETASLNITGNTASGTFSDLEMGAYAIDVTVYDGLIIIARGQGVANVMPGQNSTVNITLHFEPGGLEVVVNWGLPYEDCRDILLIGNSHTYYNGGVDNHLQGLIDSAMPMWDVNVDSITGGGYTLENHYNSISTMNAISSGDWDLVILQEQSSRPMDNPVLFYQYSTLLQQAIARSGALTGFYMTWAWGNNPEMFIPIRDAYYYIGAYLDALVIPAGVAFYQNSVSASPVNLYDADNVHASLNGTYLVACTMLAEIWNINPVGNGYVPNGIDANTANYLQQLAWDTAISY